MIQKNIFIYISFSLVFDVIPFLPCVVVVTVVWSLDTIYFCFFDLILTIRKSIVLTKKDTHQLARPLQFSF